MEQTTMTEPQRNRRRRNVIANSPHREEYERLIIGGWTSIALERYATFRFGEDIPASTFRAYRARKKIQDQIEAGAELRERVRWDRVDPDRVPDIVGLRAELVQLQRARIAIDWQTEQNIGKLFSTSAKEIELLDRLLSSMKGDLQDIGLAPKAGEKIEVSVPSPTAQEAPRAQTLGELFGQQASPEDEVALARVLHLTTKSRTAEEAG